eukprot:806535-Pleurochrysis_carterae.AAC.2
MVSSAAPNAFWDYAVHHAVDILNRTTEPPNSSFSSYELLTGKAPSDEHPTVGCRAFAVKPRSAHSK